MGVRLESVRVHTNAANYHQGAFEHLLPIGFGSGCVDSCTNDSDYSSDSLTSVNKPWVRP